LINPNPTSLYKFFNSNALALVLFLFFFLEVLILSGDNFAWDFVTWRIVGSSLNSLTPVLPSILLLL
jgi:hypothetical protein